MNSGNWLISVPAIFYTQEDFSSPDCLVHLLVILMRKSDICVRSAKALHRFPRGKTDAVKVAKMFGAHTPNQCAIKASACVPVPTAIAGSCLRSMINLTVGEPWGGVKVWTETGTPAAETVLVQLMPKKQLIVQEFATRKASYCRYFITGILICLSGRVSRRESATVSILFFSSVASSHPVLYSNIPQVSV